MRDDLLRRSIKWWARLAASLELRLVRKFAPPPRYRLFGTCNGCGRCCEAPTLQAGRFTWRLKSLRALALWWQRVVNGFELVSSDPRFRTMTFRCTHYDPVTKHCDSYGSRPLICRDYPVNLTHEANPVLFDECSHRIVDVNAEGLRDALSRTSLTPEQLEQLERKLNLKDR